MSNTFTEGQKVILTIEAEIYDTGVGVQKVEIKDADGDGWYIEVRDENLTPILPELPETEGSVILVTKWAGDAKTGWTAILRNGGAWHFSVDTAISWQARELNSEIKLGKFDFEVLYDAGAAK